MRVLFFTILLSQINILKAQTKDNIETNSITVSSIAEDDTSKVIEFTITYNKMKDAIVTRKVHVKTASDISSSYAFIENGSYAVIMDPDEGQFLQLKSVSPDKIFYLIPFTIHKKDPIRMAAISIQRMQLDCDCASNLKKHFVSYDYNNAGYLMIRCANSNNMVDSSCTLKFHSDVFDYKGKFILIPANSVVVKY